MQIAYRRPMQGPWLDPTEQEAFVAMMLHFSMLKWSNERDLKLKMGGTTDIYINLRDARNHPEAIEYLSGLFANPLRRVKPDRFVEVPDSVSCFAGPLAMETGIPYMTVRGSEKYHGASAGASIGTAPWGSTVDIIDDVITDGTSKIPAYRVMCQSGMVPRKLIVGVDRQQGWRRTFAREGIDLDVWAGMTLHDVRKLLIQKLRVMQRCRLEVEQGNAIILALDGKNWDDVLPIIDQLRPMGVILKVNDLVFDQGISNLVPDLSVYGRVMVDLKLHDIPATVFNTCRRLRPYNAWAVTVHASGGGAMVRVAKDELEGTKTKVLGITVLTSMDKETCEEVYHRRPLTQALALAKVAMGNGADGLVCSVEEVRTLRDLYPNAYLVTPGIRSPGNDTHDQARIGTPRGALENGSNYLVMGRQILGAPDPVAEVRRVLREELCGAPQSGPVLAGVY